MNWYFRVLRKYGVFKGRARRKEFWYFILINWIVHFILNGIGLEIIVVITGILLFIPTIAVTVRRLHDTGYSGWWLISPLLFWSLLIPLYISGTLGDSFSNEIYRGIGSISIAFYIVLLFALIADSNYGENKYGANPKDS